MFTAVITLNDASHSNLSHIHLSFSKILFSIKKREFLSNIVFKPLQRASEKTSVLLSVVIELRFEPVES